MRKTVTATPLSLAEVRQEIDQRLEGLFEVKIKQAHGIDPLYGQMLERMALFIRRGGKRMRPYLTYLSYIGCGGSDTAAILDVAASQELYHNFLLIHDDIIDRDLMRYDGPNLSGLYMEKFQKELADLGEARHYADAMAMLAGDLNCGLAFGV
ncbi:MAG TPA: polyprenyl synthetase family protein, partial [Candidatus Saccharimonadales bacterium]|nr:polyprenyl synthetase family protein [Candidatus Saccharimonadales bacterium]